MWRRWGTSQNSLLAVIDELWKNPKNQNFEKWTTSLEISSFYTCVPKTTIIWGTVPEIQCDTDIIFCHLGPFFALSPPWQPIRSKFWKNEKNIWKYHHFTHMYQKSWTYNIWFLRYKAQQTKFFSSLWAVFCPFILWTARKIKILKKWKKNGDNIILH